MQHLIGVISCTASLSGSVSAEGSVSGGITLPTVVPPESYSGVTIVTPTEATQVLETSRYYMTDDITVNPIPPNYKDRTIPYDFLGVAPDFLGSLYSEEYVLKNTAYNGWTPSTTAKTIVSAITLPATYAGNTEEYEYYLRWAFDADVKYKSGTTMKYVTVREFEELWQVIAKRPNSRANIAANNFNGNNCSTFYTTGFTDYYDKNGSQTYTWSASYGFYIGATAATFSNSTSDTPTITIKTPAINARCSTTYFSTARAADVDQDNTTMKLTGEMYRVKKGTSPSRRMYDYLVNIYNNPL